MQSRCEPSRWALPDEASASGCFETMRAYGGRIFRLEQHLDRLEGSMAHLGVRLSMDRAALARRLRAALARSGVREAVVRVALIPSGERLASPSIVVQRISLPTAAAYRRGIRVAVVPTRRFPVGQIDPQAKFSSRLGSILAVMEAQLRGVDEAIFLDGATGVVTESTASNLGIIKDGAVLASPCEFGLLAGVTWEAVTELAPAAGLVVGRQPLTRHDCYNADEAFLLSTIKEVLPVTMIDGRRIGTGRPGPQTMRLRRAFRRLVQRELRHGRR